MIPILIVIFLMRCHFVLTSQSFITLRVFNNFIESKQQILYNMIIMKSTNSPISSIDTHISYPAQNLSNNSKIKIKSELSSQSDSQDIFQPDFHTMKKLRLPIKRNIKKGTWAIEENKIYLSFIETHMESFESQAQRRSNRVFCQLSQFLNHKRTPDQCRTHHQKLLTRLRTLTALVEYLRQKIKDYEQYPYRRKTRVIGKLSFSKIIQREVLKVEQHPFGSVSTFKNSSHVVVEIREADIESFNFE